LKGDYSFIPESIEGMETNPKFKGVKCYGKDLRNYNPMDGWSRIELKWVIDAYQQFPRKEAFFTAYFDKLAGTDALRKQIIDNISEEEIRSSWAPGIHDFMERRKEYLLYP
jgi:uncharacterized protein YbbC (DUF1343 family)